MGEEIPSVNIHSVAVTRGSWPLWASRQEGYIPMMLSWPFIVPYEINSECVQIDPEGNDRTMESNNNTKINLYTKAHHALKMKLTCRDRFLMVTLAWTPSLHESTVASIVRLHLRLQYDSSDDSSQCLVSIIRKSTNKKRWFFSYIV